MELEVAYVIEKDDYASNVAAIRDYASSEVP